MEKKLQKIQKIKMKQLKFDQSKKMRKCITYEEN